MKESPRDNELHKRLQASKFSGEGFLGTDDRPLDEIITEDRRAQEETGVPKQELVAALKKVFAQARDSQEDEIVVSDGITARYFESRGKIPSPFRGDGVYEKGEVEVTEKASGRTLHITSLGIALIEKHDFYQGIGSYYRMSPAAIVEMLIQK
ncbi:MAG: hypothetical protein ACOC41_02425 [Chitinivibrionales bacterium]